MGSKNWQSLIFEEQSLDFIVKQIFFQSQDYASLLPIFPIIFLALCMCFRLPFNFLWWLLFILPSFLRQFQLKCRMWAKKLERTRKDKRWAGEENDYKLNNSFSSAGSRRWGPFRRRNRNRNRSNLSGGAAQTSHPSRRGPHFRDAVER